MRQREQARRHQRGPWEEFSFLFNSLLPHPGIDLVGDRVGRLAKQHIFGAVRCVPDGP